MFGTTSMRRILDYGFVEYLDHMGTDLDIVNAAKISFDKRADHLSQGQIVLLRYLLRMRHTTPFEMCELKIKVKMPIFVARQWVRHRTASINEVSARYTELPSEMYQLESWDLQSKNNKQGRAEESIDDKDIIDMLKADETDIQNLCYKVYQDRLELGIAKEIARKDLPLSIYTTWIWKIDLHNLMHFLKLRIDPHAQYEIRVYAHAVYDIARRLWPQAIIAFDDYQRFAITLSRPEQFVLQGDGDRFLTDREKGDLRKKLDIMFPNRKDMSNYLGKLLDSGPERPMILVELMEVLNY